MIDDQIRLYLRIDQGRVAAQLGHCVSHHGQIDDRRDTGEILHDHPCRIEGDLAIHLPRRIPVRQSFNIRTSDGLIVLVAQQILQEHSQRIGQSADVAETLLLQIGQTEVLILSSSNFEGPTDSKTVETVV